MPSYEFSFQVTPELGHRAARAYMWRRLGWRIPAICIAIICFSLLIVDGATEWYVFLFLGLGIAEILAWASFYRRSIGYVKTMKSSNVDVAIKDDGIEMQDVDGGGSVKWTAPVNVWKFQRLWMFTYGKTRIYTYMPIGALSDEVRSFIERKVRENGGTVS